MGAKVFYDMRERTCQMVEQRRLVAFVIIERHLLLKDVVIARFFHVIRHTQDEPERVIIKPVAYVGVPAFG